MQLCPKCHIDKDRCDCPTRRKVSSISFVVDLHIYPYKILFCFNQSDEQVLSELRRLKVSKREAGDTYKLDKSSGLAIVYKEASRALVRLAKVPSQNYHKGTLAHEIDHIGTDILNALGMYRTNASDEAYTYLNGYITYQAYAKLKGAYK